MMLDLQLRRNVLWMAVQLVFLFFSFGLLRSVFSLDVVSVLIFDDVFDISCCECVCATD